MDKTSLYVLLKQLECYLRQQIENKTNDKYFKKKKNDNSNVQFIYFA